ncbi:MAG: ABC transporter permease [Gammaproteobacteria bacterium]|nr:ABC transporter permease [Gammaproteobacteria bacterium]
MRNFVEKTGRETIYYVEHAGMMTIFLCSCLIRIFTRPFQLRAIIKQLHFIGAKSVFIIIVAGSFTGMVLGLQGYYVLQRFGSLDMIGSAVALSLIRELGPVLAALMVVGRAGSAICAEIGIMRTTEQIDALECMGIHPYKYLMVPKFIAAIISLPLLTCLFDVMGILGGYFAAVVLFGVNEGSYFQGMYSSVVWADIEMGLIKSFVFGLIIVWVATAKGFFLHLDRSGAFGAEGVSRITTKAVVLSSVAILGSDYLISAILL